MTTHFRTFINEAEMLDVSIQAAGKYLTSDKRIREFLNSSVHCTQKTDGLKLTLVKIQDNGNLEDFLVSYKGNLLYSSEYGYSSISKAKSESIGTSQFKLVFKHLDGLGKTNIPVGTELFIEFLAKKPTLSSQYSTNHKMVLIGHTKSTWVAKFGKLKTYPGDFETNNRKSYAKEMRIDVPVVLFDGKLGTEQDFSKGIKHKVLVAEFNARKKSMQWDVPEVLLDDIRDLFLSIDSKYGGKEEGVVISTSNGLLLKFQQSYQLDQLARLNIKMKFRESNPQDETKYWDYVKSSALEIAQSITPKSRELQDVMGELSSSVHLFKVQFVHSKKTTSQIKDDVQLSAKTLIVKKMRGNNNVLIIGKFRVLTKGGHFKLIKRAQTLYDHVVVCVVTSKDTKFSKSLRERMLKKTFPNIEVVNAINGNISRIIQKSSVNINAVYAGSDRVQGYADQLKHTLGVQVKEMPRTDSDISASEVLDKISDENFFKLNTPNQIHDMYNEITKTYKDNTNS